MARKHDDGAQFDLFVPYISDLPLRDQRETMERPFFSLAKRKRLKPIEYVSPNAERLRERLSQSEFGMATIWDADILIWAASTLNNLRKQRRERPPAHARFSPTIFSKPYAAIPAGSNTNSFAKRSAGSSRQPSHQYPPQGPQEATGNSAG